MTYAHTKKCDPSSGSRKWLMQRRGVFGKNKAAQFEAGIHLRLMAPAPAPFCQCGRSNSSFVPFYSYSVGLKKMTS